MRVVRTKALALRLEGKSYAEITRELAVPKSTLSGWFRDVVLSDAAEARLKARVRLGTRHAFLRRNKLQTRHAELRAKMATEAGKERIGKLTQHDLMVIGAVLYWGEGYKRLKVRDGKERMDHKIGFVNADGRMIYVFIRFLTEILEIPREKIRASMRLYPHISEAAALKYWMGVTGLPGSQFRKTSYPVSPISKKIRPYTRLPWGTLQIEACITEKFHHLLGMIEGVKNAL